jgi:hypothetical protein
MDRLGRPNRGNRNRSVRLLACRGQPQRTIYDLSLCWQFGHHSGSGHQRFERAIAGEPRMAARNMEALIRARPYVIAVSFLLVGGIPAMLLIRTV